MTSEQTPVDARPTWLRNIQVPNTTVLSLLVDNKNYSYTVVKKGLAPQLPYAVGGNVGDGTLFISEEVDPEFAPYILKHEVRHTTKYANVPPQEACLLALRDELREVAEEHPERYIEYLIGKPDENGKGGRRAFFNALVEFYKDPAQQAARGGEAVEGINRANEYIQTIDTKSGDAIPPGSFHADYSPQHIVGLQNADEFINHVDVIPPGIFSGDYTPEQLTAIANVHILGDALAQSNPEIADLYRKLDKPLTYLQIAERFIPDIAEKNPSFAARVVGNAMRQLIPPLEQGELTAAHRGLTLQKNIAEMGTQKRMEHQRRAGKTRHEKGIPVNTDAMVKGRGRTPWINEEKQMVLKILVGDKEYQHTNGHPNHAKIASLLNEIYHDGKNVRTANSVLSFVSDVRRKTKKRGN